MDLKGSLYIVATPIGNLKDISERAIEVLQTVDKIAVEDTRVSQKLLHYIGIQKPLLPLHDHNERTMASTVLDHIEAGNNIALISDAGTPLVSDPGFLLVKHAHERGIKVVPIPGPSALIAALSASGLPTDRFIFEGFLPEKSGARQTLLTQLKNETRTLIFYEAPHRLINALQDMIIVLGEGRLVTLARELTKTFETIKQGTLKDLLSWVQQDPNQTRGEIVLVVSGMPKIDKSEITDEATRILSILLSELPLKQAAALAAKITGIQKRVLYEAGLNK